MGKAGHPFPAPTQAFNRARRHTKHPAQNPATPLSSFCQTDLGQDSRGITVKHYTDMAVASRLSRGHLMPLNIYTPP